MSEQDETTKNEADGVGETPTNETHEPSVGSGYTPYQLVLYLGTVETKDLGSTIVALSPAAASPIAAVIDAGVEAADLKSKVLLAFGPEVGAALAASIYSSVTGFAGRFVDVGFIAGDQLVITDAETVVAVAGDLEDTGKPTTRPDLVCVGSSASADPGGDGVTADAALFVNATNIDLASARDIAELRWAKSVVSSNGDDPSEAVLGLIHIAGVISNQGRVRLPLVEVEGELVDTVEAYLQGTTARRLPDSVVELAEPVEATQRRLLLQAAAAVPVQDILTNLGSTSATAPSDAIDGDDEAPVYSLWQCPRPWFHTTGDSTPSMRVSEEGGRCFRCDPADIDAVQLTTSACRVTPDEAAALIIAAQDGGDTFAQFRGPILAERAKRVAAASLVDAD